MTDPTPLRAFGPGEQPRPVGPQPPPGRLAPAPPVFPNVGQTVLVLLFFIATLVAASALLAPLESRLPRHLYLFAVMLLGEGVVVLTGFRLARWPLRRVFGTLGFSITTLRRLLLVGSGTLLLVGGLIVVTTWAFGPFEQDYLIELFELEGAGEFLVLFLMVGVAAPVMEELLFRGLLLRGLVASRGVTGGIVLTALFFALIHLSPVQAVPAFVNGVVWATVLLRTGSLGSVLFLHSLNNSVVFLLVQLAMRSDVPPESNADEVTLIGAGTAVAAALGGLVLLRRGLARLPADPERLASFWGLAPGPGGAPVADPSATEAV